MKGELSAIPSVQELSLAYDKLLHHQPTSPTLEELALYSQWSRLDPRLAEIWVGYITQNWKEISPLSFREALLTQPWPGVCGVLFGFSLLLMEKSAAQLFKHWQSLITQGFPKGREEQFFIGLTLLGGEAMQEEATHSLGIYRKWGYLSRENLIQKKVSVPPSKEIRELILRKLLEKHPRIRTPLYWEAIGGSISPRQAERDLKSWRWLRGIGSTSGRYYIKK